MILSTVIPMPTIWRPDSCAALGLMHGPNSRALALACLGHNWPPGCPSFFGRHKGPWIPWFTTGVVVHWLRVYLLLNRAVNRAIVLLDPATIKFNQILRVSCISIRRVLSATRAKSRHCPQGVRWPRPSRECRDLQGAPLMLYSRLLVCDPLPA
jgi:hypothetical protein